MVRDLKKEQLNEMLTKDFDIRELSKGEIDKLKKEIKIIENRIQQGDSSQETKSELEKNQKELSATIEIAFGRD